VHPKWRIVLEFLSRLLGGEEPSEVGSSKREFLSRLLGGEDKS
tara:strand:+ start:8665 stop:8793 length:129 start_codon:yes stop_codon:yes gene_type:complete